MTRKDALREAIHIISKARIGKRRKEDILAGLMLCQRELPFARWTREAVFDACDTWVQEHGELRLGDFAQPVLPSRSTIKSRFGMTAREFRDRCYPLAGGPSASPYRKRAVEEWNRAFRADFHRMRCTGQEDYNRRRDRGLPTWNTVAGMNGVRSWRELLKKLELSPYEKPKPRPEVKVRVVGPDG